jgi:hypothetical protein
MLVATGFRMQRDSPQVQHRQHVGVAHLVLQAHSQHVEPVQRREGFETVQRQPRGAQFPLEIRQRGEGAFAGPARVVVDDAVQHLHAVVAHAQGIGVGEGEADRALQRGVVLGDGVAFAADVLPGRGHPRQDCLDPRPQRLPIHAMCSRAAKSFAGRAL